MFKAGDTVVHPVRGAGVVECVEERRWRGSDTLYYRIDLLSQPGSSLMIPVETAEELGLRRAVSQSRLKQIWGVLCADPETLPTKHKERYRLLADKLHAGDVQQVVEAVRDMAWRRQREGKLTTRGKRIYEEGITLLAGEIAAAKGIDLAEAEAQIRAKLRENLQPETAS